jgi:predicted transcriptional regulator
MKAPKGKATIAKMTITLPPELKEKLQQAAKQAHRSASGQACFFLAELLTTVPKAQ